MVAIDLLRISCCKVWKLLVAVDSRLVCRSASSLQRVYEFEHRSVFEYGIPIPNYN